MHLILDAIRDIYKSTAFQQRENDLLQILHSNYDGSIIYKIRIIKNEEKQLLFIKYKTEDWDEIWHKAILDGNYAFSDNQLASVIIFASLMILLKLLVLVLLRIIN